MTSFSLISRAGEVIQNRFLLTKIVIDRIRELENGAKPKIDVEKNVPLMEVALNEIIEGKIELTGLEESGLIDTK